MSTHNRIIPLDLNFMGMPGVIAVYLIPHHYGALLIECGPGSTIPALERGLQANGFSLSAISDVFVTHIHLDHAGAAGLLAHKGANIHVHPLGAPHLNNPEKLLLSAGRIYGDMMQTLWGEFLPVPAERLFVIEDGQVVNIGGVELRAIDTPGHANHHHAYIVEEVCFSGDIGGVRRAGTHHLRLPTPPPEFHLESWRQSLEKLRREGFSRLAPTHFGLFDDREWHLNTIGKNLDEIEAWMQTFMPQGLPPEQLSEAFQMWIQERSERDGVDASAVKRYETAIPSFMSVQGIQRYWQKYRQNQPLEH